MDTRAPLPFAAAGPELGDAAWVDVLRAVDRTYAELVDYQERLEARNNELTALQNFMASVMGSISDFLVVVQRDGSIAEASQSFCRAVGSGIDRLAGRAIADFVAAGDRARMMETVSRVLSGAPEATVEVELRTASGCDPVEFRINPRLDRRRKATGAVLTGRPLGELRRAYSELAESHDALKEAQSHLVRNEKLASLGRLLAGVAHELNNPISFVYANTHALEKYAARFETYFERVSEGASREELIALRHELKLDRELRNLRTAIHGARDGAERVRDIVEDLRRLSAEGTGEMIAFDLAACARVAANWVERGTKSGLSVTIEGAATAFGRPGHIQQVFMNLVQNAADAMAGQADAAVRITLSEEEDAAVAVVSDTGPGIPEAQSAAIFDPFFTTKEVGQGTGLGLSISHKIAEEHGGTLTLDPAGPGASFRLRLRLRKGTP